MKDVVAFDGGNRLVIARESWAKTFISVLCTAVMIVTMVPNTEIARAEESNPSLEASSISLSRDTGVDLFTLSLRAKAPNGLRWMDVECAKPIGTGVRPLLVRLLPTPRRNGSNAIVEFFGATRLDTPIAASAAESDVTSWELTFEWPTNVNFRSQDACDFKYSILDLQGDEVSGDLGQTLFLDGTQKSLRTSKTPTEDEDNGVSEQPAKTKFIAAQKTLATYRNSVTQLSSLQKAQIRASLDANPNAEKFICTGIRYHDQPMSVNIMVRKRAKAACEYAKQLNPELSTWYQNKPTQARSYAGKVLLTIKTPSN